ncbi:Hsp70 family protein [Dactylosporangium sp. NPDC050688]|uniref:Hsp70 family protein n=1 Tax=Dactylosporangium sp. NPDC050688 TaxID=3157217 RepID=UPI0033DA35E6
MLTRASNGTSAGFTVTSTEGLPDAGGLDVDAALVAHVGAAYAVLDPQRWQRLQHPVDATDRRARWTLWEDIRTAKEMLSRSSSTSIHVPLYDRDTVLTRDQFEVLARPVIDRTVAAARAAQAAAGGAAPSAILLVGGSSRIPLAATVLHRVTGVAPTTLEQPETAVAEGAALHAG